ncbi:hypothetical protein GmRootV59_22950 [Variovorax sp. V59]
MSGSLQTQLTSSLIERHRFYDVPFLAGLLGVSEQTVYQAAGGFKRFPLPKVTRLGRTLRFLGLHIHQYIETHAGIEAATTFGGLVPNAAHAVLPPPPSRRRGRPRKAASTSAGGAA